MDELWALMMVMQTVSKDCNLVMLGSSKGLDSDLPFVVSCLG
jgi:hypothetical protein